MLHRIINTKVINKIKTVEIPIKEKWETDGTRSSMKISHIHFKENYVNIGWYSDELGWGELEFYFTLDGKLMIDSETMGKEFIKEVLEQVVENAILKDYDDK